MVINKKHNAGHVPHLTIFNSNGIRILDEPDTARQPQSALAKKKRFLPTLIGRNRPNEKMNFVEGELTISWLFISVR